MYAFISDIAVAIIYPFQIEILLPYYLIIYQLLLKAIKKFRCSPVMIYFYYKNTKTAGKGLLPVFNTEKIEVCI